MNFIIIIVGLFMLIGFYKIFMGIYIGYLINQGLYKTNELDEFPLYFTNEEEYSHALEKLNCFMLQILENLECRLSITSNDINCLVYKGLTPVKPYYLTSKTGLLFYYFELNRLFKRKMSYAGPDGVYSVKDEILFVQKIPYATSETIFTEPEIFVREDFVYPDLPLNNLEVRLREKESKLIKGAFIYRSLFIRSLFNSDLNFTEEEIVNALKKVTSVEIVDNQLIFTADDRG
jgi:hypothetical protein